MRKGRLKSSHWCRGLYAGDKKTFREGHKQTMGRKRRAYGMFKAMISVFRYDYENIFHDATKLEWKTWRFNVIRNQSKRETFARN